MWINILLAKWATVQLTVLHLCVKPLASSWLLNPQLPGLCSLCQHPAGSKCVTACQQQVASRPVFILYWSLFALYTHMHAHTYAHYTHARAHTQTHTNKHPSHLSSQTHTRHDTQSKQETGGDDVTKGQRALIYLFSPFFLSLCLFFNVFSLFPKGQISNTSFFLKLRSMLT